MIVKSFNRAGEKALLVGGTYDFAQQGLPGLALNADIVFGRDAVDATTDAALSNNTEYGLTLDYRFSAARAAHVDQGAAGKIDDYRIIVNYPIAW